MEGMSKTGFDGAVPQKETWQGQPLMVLMDGPAS